jgi:hypothetical protein
VDTSEQPPSAAESGGSSAADPAADPGSFERALRARFDALPERQRTAILDKHRDWNIDHEWWSSVYAEFIGRMDKQGVYVNDDDIHFSGFWSQGDGASFSGAIDDFAAFVAHHRLEFPNLVWVREEGGLSGAFRVSLWRSYYVHSGGMQTDDWPHITGSDCWAGPSDDMPLLIRLATEHRVGLAEKELEEFESTFLQLMRDAADELYSELEKEYEDLTSDESVLDSLIASLAIEDDITEYEEQNRDDDDSHEDDDPDQRSSAAQADACAH